MVTKLTGAKKTIKQLKKKNRLRSSSVLMLGGIRSIYQGTWGLMLKNTSFVRGLQKCQAVLVLSSEELIKKKKKPTRFQDGGQEKNSGPRMSGWGGSLVNLGKKNGSKGGGDPAAGGENEQLSDTKNKHNSN